MAMLSNQDLIRRVPLFANLTSDQVNHLAANITKRTIKKGDEVVRQGENSNALFLILSGRAHVLMTDSKGKEVILATLKAGDYIGEMSLIDNEAHSATVQAETKMDVLVLGREDFIRAVSNNVAIAAAVMCGLVQRLRMADQKIVSLALMGVYGRVATVLLDMAESIDKSELLIREKISRSNISKMVGASREMVGRVMKDFEDQGFIQTNQDGGIRIWERRSKPR
jgi:CRP/FNR family transcriptional regulator, cyclic AMP receptor protein